MHYELKNEELTITVASQGAELRRAVDNRTGRDYLWSGDAAYWGRVSPVLFPVVGNYFEHKSIYEGKTYTLGQHGFARDMAFSLLSQTDTALWLRLVSSKETRAVYPFDFVLDIGYELSGREIQVLWRVENPNDKTMYFSIGAHPAFLADLAADALLFDARGDLEVTYIDPQTACVGERTEAMPLTDGVLPMTPELFDDDALILADNQTHDVTLLDREGRAVVQVRFDAPLVGIWSPAKKNAPFVCIEPWYGRSDRNGFNQQLAEREWGNALAAGETFAAAYTVRLLG